jgi:hypothetical protein
MARPQLPEGYRVKYRHGRMSTGGIDFVAGMSWSGLPSPKGGETEARVYGPDDSLVALGIATCHERDNFCRRIGRDIALGRALKQLDRKAVER